MVEKFWFLKSCSLFEQLSEAEIVDLERRARIKSFARGELVYMPADPGDSVFLIVSGRIKLYSITSDGKQSVLALIDPGEVFGELAVLDGAPREDFAEAMDATKIISMPRDHLQSLMNAHATVALGVTKLMGLRRQRIERRLKSLMFRSNRERIIHLLLELVEKYGQRSPDGVAIGIKLSHQELASIIGSTRETVTVVLGELQREGNISIHRRRIIMHEMGRLARSVDSEPPTLPVNPPQALARTM